MIDWVKKAAQRTSLGRLAAGFVALASVAAIVYGLLINWHELANYNWKITWWPILVSLLLYPAALGLGVVAWGNILRQIGVRSHWRDDLRIYCASNIARRLPTIAWFVAQRIHLGSQIGIRKAVSSFAMVLESVLILFSGLFVSMIAWPFGIDATLSQFKVLRLIPLLLLCLAAILRPQLLRRLFDWLALRLGHRRIAAGEVSPRHMLLWAILHGTVWVICGVILFLLVHAIYPLPLSSLPAIVGIWAIGGVVSHVAIFMPGGLGLKEATLAALLSHLIPVPLAIVVAIFARIWFSLNELLWFALTFRLKRRL